MASDPVITDVDREQIREYLAEILRAGDDFGRFVDEQFDTLESIAAKLQERERELQVERALVSGQLAGLTQARERLEAASLAAERWAAQAPTREFAATSTDEGPEHAGQIATALAAFQNDQSAQIATALSTLQSNQARMNEELAGAQTQLSEKLAAAQVQAQSHFATLAQSVAAELGEARSQLSAASEDLARERQKIVEAAEPFSNEKLTAAQTRWNEELAAAQTQAQSQFAALAESVAAELTQARSQLSAANEELALERARIAEAAQPLLSAAAAATAAATAAPGVVETTPPVSVPDAAAPVESIRAAQPKSETPPEPAHSKVATPAAAPEVDVPVEDETAGWWGELQQLRRGLSKAVQPQGDAPQRRTKAPAPS